MSTQKMYAHLFSGILLVSLLILPQLVWSKTEYRSWLGTGISSGKYQEKQNSIDEDISGRSKEIVLFHRKGGYGISTGLGIQDTIVDTSFVDENKNQHDIYYRNVSGYALLGLKIKIWFLHIGVHGLAGKGETTFSKKFISSANDETTYETAKFQNDFIGSEGMVFLDLEDNWVLGAKQGNYNHKLDAKFGDVEAVITNNQIITVFIGVEW